jgi:hypothetical protein
MKPAAGVPMWVEPWEPLTSDAIALFCDADRRPRDAGETLIVRVIPLP